LQSPPCNGLVLHTVPLSSAIDNGTFGLMRELIHRDKSWNCRVISAEHFADGYLLIDGNAASTVRPVPFSRERYTPRMPELPELEVVKEVLQHCVVGSGHHGQIGYNRCNTQ
jgi:hypothetical protein